MSSGSEGDSGSGYSEGKRGFKLKKHKEKKDKKDKDKKDKDKDKEKKEKKDKDKDKKDKDKKDKDKKDKKDKEKDKKEESSHAYDGSHSFSGPGYGAAVGGGAAAEYLSSSMSSTATSVPAGFQAHGPTGQVAPAPPPYAPSPGFPQTSVDTKFPQYPPPPAPPMGNPPPPSGFRVPLRTDSSFPLVDQTGPPIAYDADGTSPIFIGSALFETSVHPCKIGPHLQPPVSVAYGGGEHGHHGRYDLLPFVPEQMEWVPASYGQIPPGRRPIEGGYEENGGKLYHALANVNGVRVPGKTGEHL